MYADDILIISSVDSHLQILLDKCANYGSLWMIKFNPSKSNLISFGKSHFDNNYDFFINDHPITKVNQLKYLGITIDSDLNFDKLACENFKKVQNSIFSLSFLGLKPNTIDTDLQSFIYKTYCLSKFTYGLETTTLQTKTRDFLNIAQNKCIRQIVGLKKTCHISNVLKCLNIFNI